MSVLGFGGEVRGMGRREKAKSKLDSFEFLIGFKVSSGFVDVGEALAPLPTHPKLIKHLANNLVNIRSTILVNNTGC